MQSASPRPLAVTAAAVIGVAEANGWVVARDNGHPAKAANLTRCLKMLRGESSMVYSKELAVESAMGIVREQQRAVLLLADDGELQELDVDDADRWMRMVFAKAYDELVEIVG